MRTNNSRHGKQKTRARLDRRAPSKTNARTNWQRKLDHYLRRARAAAEAGDRIEAENYYQHAEHYRRMIAGTAA